MQQATIVLVFALHLLLVLAFMQCNAIQRNTYMSNKYPVNKSTHTCQYVYRLQLHYLPM